MKVILIRKGSAHQPSKNTIKHSKDEAIEWVGASTERRSQPKCKVVNFIWIENKTLSSEIIFCKTKSLINPNRKLYTFTFNTYKIQNKQNDNENENEIKFVDSFRNALRTWWRILMLSSFFACLLACLRIVSSLSHQE